MISKHYPGLFEKNYLKTKAVSVVRRTFEFTEFLVYLLKIKLEDLGNPIEVT